MYIHSIFPDTHHGKDFTVEKSVGIIDFIYLIIKSQSVLALGTQVYTISTPTAVLINSHTPYKYISLSENYSDDYLHFAPDNLNTFIDELTFPFNTPIILTDYRSIYDTFTALFDEHENQEINIKSAEACDLLLKYLMIKTGRQWNKINNRNNGTPHYDELVKIRETIFKHPEKSWTITALAEQAHLSPAYFQVLYRRAFGATCINDVIDTKISHAKELLLSTNLTVNDISKELGYNEVYHFIRQFKKSTGITPGAFRKRL